MKKLLMLAMVAVCAIQAHAAMTVTYSSNVIWGDDGEGNYGTITVSDKNPHTELYQYLSVYGLSDAEVRNIVGAYSATSFKNDSKASTTAQASQIRASNVQVAQAGISAISQWLANNFTANSETWKSASSDVSKDYTNLATPETKAYRATLNVEPDQGGTDGIWKARWAVVFYDDGTDNLAYRVVCVGIQARTGYEGTFTTSDASILMYEGLNTSGDWVSVPEPTSGLLLLLGVAGLALKRKRV